MTGEVEGTASQRPTGAPVWLRRAVHRLEAAAPLDRVAAAIDDASHPLASGRPGDFLRGEWLGHALHPLLTDLPLGCWIGAGLLDIVGGRRSSAGARRLVGLGLLASVPTAAAGLAELNVVRDDRARRVATVHGIGNVVVVACYFRSWTIRRRSRARGVLWGVAGGTLAWATGYLGGHLSFARAVGVGPRGLEKANADLHPWADSSVPGEPDGPTVESSHVLAPPAVITRT